MDMGPRFEEAAYQARWRRDALHTRITGLLAPHLAEEVLADIAELVAAERRTVAVVADIMDRARRG